MYKKRTIEQTIFENCAMSGAFFETSVVSEILKNFFAFNKNPRNYLYYYPDIDQKEIDLEYRGRSGKMPENWEKFM